MSSKRQKPKIYHTQIIAKSRLFYIEEVHLRFSNGNETCFERLKSHSRGAVLIVPMLDEDTVLLIREYAAGVDRYELLLPKGKVDEGESFKQAANRELMEEVGYGAKKIHHLTSMTVAPAYLGHTTQIMLAQDLYPQKEEGDEPEPIEVIPWSLSRLNELVARDDYTEARSIAALFMAREYLRTQ